MNRILILFGVVVLIIGSILYLESKKTERAPALNYGSEPLPSVGALAFAGKAAMYEPAKEISSADGFINTDGITVGEFVGKKVVLVDFWTYSCINCQRTTPYLNAWHERYKDKGLVIIGVHTPEFEFEKQYDNVLSAVKKFGIEYPVVLDNDFSTWIAYKNRYWPRKYLVDIDGYIVYDHIGEGGYEETERKIQEALAERMERLAMENGIPTDIAQPEGVVTVDPAKRISPEIYFGAWRNENFVSGRPGELGVKDFSASGEVRANRVYFDGRWDIQQQYAENVSDGAKIVFRYQAKNVYMVANHPEGVTVRVLRDGKPLVEDAGDDVKNGSMRVDDDRLYHIVSDDDYGEHTLELLIEGPGLQAFTFTFG